MSERHTVVVGESIAGVTAVRELRALGHRGAITLIGADPHGSYARPPLSKAVLEDSSADATLGYPLDDLGVTSVRSAAVAADFDRRTVVTADGDIISYDALIIASGAEARRIAAPGQRGELVLRTLDDARTLRPRLDTATSVIVVGAGFLGMEVASACVTRGIPVTVIDVDPPLQAVLGSYLSGVISSRAEEHGVRIVRTTEFVTLVGDPVNGVALPGGEVLTADLVVTCAGEIPNTSWLAGTGLADRNGIGIDDACTTAAPDVYAAGDVAYLRAANKRAPFWSNAVAQARVAAASALGLPAAAAASDNYFWTEILGIAIKVVGPLPVIGAPTSLEGNPADGSALLIWRHGAGGATVVAYGIRKSIAGLRSLADAPSCSPQT